MTAKPIIQYGPALEACGRVHWHLEAASKLLIEPSNAAIFLPEFDCDYPLRKVSEAMSAVEDLHAAFKRARKAE